MIGFFISYCWYRRDLKKIHQLINKNEYLSILWLSKVNTFLISNGRSGTESLKGLYLCFTLYTVLSMTLFLQRCYDLVLIQPVDSPI